VSPFACVEFVKMMVKVDCLPEAARILGFLESTGSLEVSTLRSLVVGTTGGFDVDGDHERRIGGDLDNRHALTFMRDVLDRLLDGGCRLGSPSPDTSGRMPGRSPR
jgi:hypothetical protein